MKTWQVLVQTMVETWIPVEAETEEEAEQKALVEADNMDLNEGVAQDSYVVEVVEEDDE